MTVEDDNDHRIECTDAERRNERGGAVERDAQSLEETTRLSLSLPVPSYRSFLHPVIAL